MRDLDEQIRTIDVSRNAIVAKTADDRAKAVADAARLAGEDAAKAGQLLHGQLEQIAATDGNPLDAYGKAADAANRYRATIASVEAEYDKLIAKAREVGDALAVKQLGDEKIHVSVDAGKTLEQVHTLAGDVHAALQQPLAGAFDSMIETQGGLTQRLRAGAQSFLESITKMLADYAARMAANGLLTAILGPAAGQPGGGAAPGGVGVGAAGGLAGSLGAALFGSTAKVGTGNVAGPGLLSQAGTVIGGAASAVGNGAGDVASGLGNILGNLFAEGGYTGNAAPSTPVGIVHGQEHVIPYAAVKHYGTPFLDAVASRRLTFAMGSPTAPAAAHGGGGNMNAAMAEAVGHLGTMASRINEQRVVAVPINEQTAGGYADSPVMVRRMLQSMARHPDFAKAVRAAQR